jgi:hypothetical protein
MEWLESLVHGVWLWPKLPEGLNFCGALLLLLSYRKSLQNPDKRGGEGRSVYLASFTHPHLFRLGVLLLALGFLLRILR